ncbi:MAG: hypothetical protein ACLSB9_15795 [Hydrogeniiclostridium mannosilyticum]
MRRLPQPQRRPRRVLAGGLEANAAEQTERLSSGAAVKREMYRKRCRRPTGIPAVLPRRLRNRLHSPRCARKRGTASPRGRMSAA